MTRSWATIWSRAGGRDGDLLLHGHGSAIARGVHYGSFVDFHLILAHGVFADPNAGQVALARGVSE